MKKYLVLMLAVLGVAFTSQAQENKSKNAKVDLEVKGNSDMCKKRIEKAAFSVKGVKSADRHSHDQRLHLIDHEHKTNATQIEEALPKAGPGSNNIQGPKASYERL